MSYGQNGPQGLQSIKSLGAASWNGQSNPYAIKSTEATSIFRGDPVYVGTDGYLHSLAASGAQATTAIVGVFAGCSFTTSTGVNPIDPASPGRSYWPGGTVTLGGLDATGYVIDDPNTIFNIQANNATALTRAGTIGFLCPISFAIAGNVVNGISGATVNTAAPVNGLALATALTAGLGAVALKILNSNAYPGNNFGINYQNFDVLIQNHAYAQRNIVAIPA